ncbi:MAG: cutinase family protein [Umezawaea sp.]
MSSSPSGALRRLPTLLFASAMVLAGTAVVAPAASAAPCTDIDVAVARGTFEPGSLGFIVGDPVYSALQRSIRFRSLSSYAVDYPANLDLMSATKGNQDLVNHVKNQAAACPNQRFILVGYSQGANVVDNSIGISSAGAVVGAPIAATIPANLESRVAAVLVFGNPIRSVGRRITGTYESRTKDFCAGGDPICEKGGGNTLAHLGYGGNANEAAAFAAGKV